MLDSEPVPIDPVLLGDTAATDYTPTSAILPGKTATGELKMQQAFATSL